MEERIEKVETRLNKLEKDREYMVQHIQELQIAIEKLRQSPVSNPPDFNQPVHAKIEYLTAANEQMFQQNQRLRQYIEDCINGEKTLEQKGYLRALSGEDS
ncbi:hypothetical protein DS745_05580 [Anaerobacillus alkaliphilus]|uniref:Uncharacterized protein n=1 Tax=Anaerobacillus alkaliphilus TaxID=1548597 RepID=A0A4Q0VVA0_9BACI|nr:hypothetical protein [Anaerobacillus alkaliphilus]RXJ02780.1 hypothetical protein DS745_05580 [Anaerobacillus alkaliphilus]